MLVGCVFVVFDWCFVFVVCGVYGMFVCMCVYGGMSVFDAVRVGGVCVCASVCVNVVFMCDLCIFCLSVLFLCGLLCIFMFCVVFVWWCVCVRYVCGVVCVHWCAFLWVFA